MGITTFYPIISRWLVRNDNPELGLFIALTDDQLHIAVIAKPFFALSGCRLRDAADVLKLLIRDGRAGAVIAAVPLITQAMAIT